MLADPSTYPWKDSDTTDGSSITVTYSFMLDGDSMDEGASNP